MTAEPKFGEWRLIKDATEADAGKVLLHFEGFELTTGRLHVDGDHKVGRCSWIHGGNATHFMPLPAPPKSEEANG